MSDDSKPAADRRRPPMNVYTAMLAMSFVAMTIACVILAIDLFAKDRLPLKP
ncbi:MAG: hypothetical protein ACKOYJ_11745 [Planctomycetia bacterium]